MSRDALPVVVAGSRFGQFYAAGLAGSGDYRLAGILANGGARSAALAAKVGVPLYETPEALPDDVRLACVAVGGAARGAAGGELARRLMMRGIDVLIEHPLLPVQWDDLLREAGRHRRRCLLNGFYPNLPVVAKFIDVARRLGRQRGAVHVDATCSVQLGYALLEVLAGMLEGVGPWSIEPERAGRSSMRACSMMLVETPVSLRVHNEMAAGDDGRMQLLFRIALQVDGGTWTLASPHGPLLWEPAIRAPGTDARGLFPIFDGAAGVSGLPSVQLYEARPPGWEHIHATVWPQAAVRALAPLVTGHGLAAANQRSTEVTRLWQRLTGVLGFPAQPLHDLPGEALEQALEHTLEPAE
ncbi:Gfo/Idh/MocA family oxidoreductase [Burkholderia plantarii]|uniref:Gfo/Idh/MocA family oxidoreductase n=1 Tax=Burkholderia plantarii TaxID=41899 RepID=UPI0006D8C737|nr:pyochelin biosynthetic protein PchG [Burkholderia plantarii]GLZ19312.1 pyochelin biosynthetic protein [Burkholderia plantarii]